MNFFLTFIKDLGKNLNIFFRVRYLYEYFLVYQRKNNILNDFYTDTKTEILGYEDYLKLDTSEQYKIIRIGYNG